MKSVLLKLITGIAVGTVAGILLAPQRGTETRQQLARGTAELGLRSKEVANRMRESEAAKRLMEGSVGVWKRVAGIASSVGQQVGRTLGITQQGTCPQADGRSEFEGLAGEYNNLHRASEKMPEKSRGGTLAWLMAGALGGLAIGILMAPKPGRATREEVARKANQLRLQSEETAARLVSRYRNME